MANIFTYSSLPGYANTTTSYLTKLQKQRLGYWTGDKQKQEFDLSKFYQNKAQNLSLLKSKSFTDLAQQHMMQNQQGQMVKQGITTAMGGQKKGSLWNDPTSYQWWNRTGGEFTPTPKMIPGTGKLVGTMVKNPDWSFGKGLGNLSAKAASSGFGQAGAWAAGKPASIAGIAGMGISYFADDKDPGTYTGWEKTGDALSWGSTAMKVAAMVNPALAIPAALVAAYLAIKGGESKKDEYLAAQQKWQDEQDELKKDFRIQQREISIIGGTKPIDMNWWNTTYS
jgi:hypothetical protein